MAVRALRERIDGLHPILSMGVRGLSIGWPMIGGLLGGPVGIGIGTLASAAYTLTVTGSFKKAASTCGLGALVAVAWPPPVPLSPALIGTASAALTTSPFVSATALWLRERVGAPPLT